MEDKCPVSQLPATLGVEGGSTKFGGGRVVLQLGGGRGLFILKN